MAADARLRQGRIDRPGSGSSLPKPSLLGKDQAALEGVLEGLGEPASRAPMRARQIRHWLYHQGATSFEAMTTLPAALRQQLDGACAIGRPAIVDEQHSSDGTAKWLLRFRDGQDVEMVHIPNVQGGGPNVQGGGMVQDGPEVERGALCVSSQVGCSLTCAFCHTGTMPLVRNLAAGDILGQILVARDRLDEWPTPTGQRRISHIVMMGMGEPLLNYENVRAALLIAMDPDGLAFPKRKITLSTSGIVPRIEQCGRELGVNLAISLHAVRDDLRDELVPINRKWNIRSLIEACSAYPAGDRWVTFEYVMLDGVNDSDAEARDLVRLLRGLPAKVNLIPFNPWPGSAYRCSRPERIEAFARIVERGGYPSPVRTPRGRDIAAACGQLKTASARRRRAAADSLLAPA
jgi:23S rRNA (adenine2503-C2)-methyltransferase